jgi:hypothetical protein
MDRSSRGQLTRVEDQASPNARRNFWLWIGGYVVVLCAAGAAVISDSLASAVWTALFMGCFFAVSVALGRWYYRRFVEPGQKRSIARMRRRRQ